MLTQEHTTEMTEVRPFLSSTKINFNFPDLSEPDSEIVTNVPPPRLFANIARTTLAERFPLLTCFAICFALLASALITEVECLKGSGYFWR